MLSKRIALIVYRFPPMGGIGSRRWAKFCKYLSEAGWEFHVITSDYPWTDPINWEDDIKDLPGLRIIRLPTGYPPIFMKPRDGNWLLVRGIDLYRRLFHLFYRSQMPFDYANIWTKRLVEFTSEYIRREKVESLVVSGPPSSLFQCGAIIKSEVPSVRLILDYRDPWSSVHDVAIEALRDAEVKVQIINAEAMALRVADRVVVVTEQMATELQSVFSIDRSKVAVIYNGFDRDDYRIIGVSEFQKTPGKINVCYLGAFGGNPNGRVSALVLIAKAVELLPRNFQDRFEFDLYSDLPSDYFASTESRFLRECVRCRSMLPRAGVAHVLAQSDICLSINRKEDGHAFGTKLFDYMAAGKPVMQVTPPGELDELLREAGQYVFDYDLKQAAQVILKVVEDYDSIQGLISVPSEISSRFDLRVLSKRYESLLG